MTSIDKDTEIQLLKAEISKGIRCEIMLSDVIHNHVIAMRAAVVAGHLESPDRGLQWIYNTLRGPGHLPDIDEALAMGGAQAMFDAEEKEHEAFRAARPGPEPESSPEPVAVRLLRELTEAATEAGEFCGTARVVWIGDVQSIFAGLTPKSERAPKINDRPAGGGA